MNTSKWDTRLKQVIRIPFLTFFSFSLCLAGGLEERVSALASYKDIARTLLENRRPEIQSERQVFKDQLTKIWMDKKVLLKGETSTVFLAIGNASQNPSSWSDSRMKTVKWLITVLHQKGYRIAYDRDSPLLSKLVRGLLSPRFRLGIGGILQPDKPHAFSIQNPSLRLDLLLSFPHIVVAPDSVLGAALILEGIPRGPAGPKFHALADGNTEQFQSLIHWATQLSQKQSSYNFALNEELGVKYPASYFPTLSGPVHTQLSRHERHMKDPFPVQREDARNEGSGGAMASFPPYQIENIVETLSEDSLKFSIEFSRDFVQHSEDAVTDPKTNARFKEGIVLFGSGKGSPRDEGVVGASVKVLAQHGYSITTGGDDGFMAVANEIAKNGGVPSIGIRKMKNGKISLDDVFSPIHTRTVHTRDDDERISILLQSRKFIVIAPGGSETMKDLATTLVQFSSQLGSIPPLVFLDRDYYGGLVQWLKELHLPDALKKKIYLIHSREEMEKLCIEAESLFSYLYNKF